MQDRNKKPFIFNEFITNIKSGANAIREIVICGIIVFALVCPKTINQIIIDLGIRKIGDVEWNVAEKDSAMLDVITVMNDLKKQNDDLNKVITQVKNNITDSATKHDIEKFEQLNKILNINASKVQYTIESITATNAVAVQNARISQGITVTWGVVYGADKTLDLAKYEVEVTAPKIGLINATTYYRQGYYRSVSLTTDRVQAELYLSKAKTLKRDAYIVDMSKWCPNSIQNGDYIECSNL